MIWLSLPPALMLGFASALHCLGMCGGIMGGFMLLLPTDMPARQRALYGLSYNLGRVGMYGALGAVAGFMGARAFGVFEPGTAFGWARLLAALILGITGISMLLGQVPGQWLNKHLWPLWQRIQITPINPAQSFFHALAAGMVWGLLPCGLVYTALAYAILSPTPMMGGLSMMLFGIGTLPGLLLPGWLARRPKLRPHQNLPRALMGGVLVGYAGFTLFWPGNHNPLLCRVASPTAPAAVAKHQY